ncbi:MAG: hypothetical protein P8N40_02890 [Gammaproteobacteria bacterium]|nr:hypothetical protein [Gammaproteobacteria bacterium]
MIPPRSSDQMTNDIDIKIQSEEIVGPFTDIVQQSALLIWDITSSNIPIDLHWDRLLILVSLSNLIRYVQWSWV